MKLRFHGPSLRLRLSQAEVAGLAAGTAAECSTPMAGGALHCVVMPDSRAPSIEAALEGGFIRVSIPAASIGGWADSDVEGMYADQPVGTSGGVLKIAIEKDYACLHKTSENEGAFPNPAAGVARR